MTGMFKLVMVMIVAVSLGAVSGDLLVVFLHEKLTLRKDRIFAVSMMFTILFFPLVVAWFMLKPGDLKYAVFSCLIGFAYGYIGQKARMARLQNRTVI